MAVDKPTGDNARKGVVKKRSQSKTTIGGPSGWTKRDREKPRPGARGSSKPTSPGEAMSAPLMALIFQALECSRKLCRGRSLFVNALAQRNRV
ncbi:hypothetical protein FXB40_01945 [Bradyrhizobium rifense]|uniref:Uncharacterized protein n=1 Tax=Bradyrhizobium rifense TaxID=515499 RepID=A0A5D3KN53_9BRAD|nr:hypothetical protein FXB40_01945 [Bradyrhizobium rifense]